MVVTAYTDGSYLSDCGVAAFSYWLKSHRGSRQLGRLCPPEITDISQAETYAILQTVAHAATLYPSLTRITVFSDSKAAITLLSGERSPVSAGMGKTAVNERLVRAWQALLASASFDVVVAYRAAHMTDRSNGTYAANWCDMMARNTAIQEQQRRKAAQQNRRKVAVRGPGKGVPGRK